jgi:hypothetical protein
MLGTRDGLAAKPSKQEKKGGSPWMPWLAGHAAAFSRGPRARRVHHGIAQCFSIVEWCVDWSGSAAHACGSSPQVAGLRVSSCDFAVFIRLSSCEDTCTRLSKPAKMVALCMFLLT